MLAPEVKKLYNQSKIVALRLYQEMQRIKDLQPFHTSKFSLIANGLGLSVDNASYQGHVYITEDDAQNLQVSFAPRKRNPLYLRTSIEYLAIFTQLLKSKELQNEPHFSIQICPSRQNIYP